MTLHQNRVLLSLTLLLGATVPLACNNPAGSPNAEAGKARPAESHPLDENGQMQAGLEALYTRHDPQAAATAFRKVLEQNPTHYGATYQLAAALDAAGKPEEARPLWEHMPQMAEGYNDKETTETARARIARTP
jgi:Tfp pilus assembly protein PilF